MTKIILIAALLIACSNAWASSESTVSNKTARVQKAENVLEETTDQSVRETLGWRPQSGDLNDFEGALSDRFPSDSERREDRNARY